MITLITGTPGSGKTLYSLRFLKEILKQNRFVYVHGITGLTLPHEVVVCASKSCDYCQSLEDYNSYKRVADWSNYADDGSVFFVDECQHIYRARGSSPVEHFETHRHRGLDFYLVTQHPMFIEPNLRKLVGKHIHLIADFLGRRQYEWSECSQNLFKSNAVKSKYNLDKSLFALYHSASIHTKVSRKIPFKFYIMIFAFFAALYLGYDTITNSHLFNSDTQSAVNPNPNPVSAITGITGIISPSENDLEKLPESDMWHIDTMQYYDFKSGEAKYDLVKDKSYRLISYDGYQRYISAKRCQLIDAELLCNLGGKLVAQWTGRTTDKPHSTHPLGTVVDIAKN